MALIGNVYFLFEQVKNKLVDLAGVKIKRLCWRIVHRTDATLSLAR